MEYSFFCQPCGVVIRATHTSHHHELKHRFQVRKLNNGNSTGVGGGVQGGGAGGGVGLTISNTPVLVNQSGKPTMPRRSEGRKLMVSGTSGSATTVPKNTGEKVMGITQQSRGKATPAPNQSGGKATPALNQSGGKATAVAQHRGGKPTVLGFGGRMITVPNVGAEKSSVLNSGRKVTLANTGEGRPTVQPSASTVGNINQRTSKQGMERLTHMNTKSESGANPMPVGKDLTKMLDEFFKKRGEGKRDGAGNGAKAAHSKSQKTPTCPTPGPSDLLSGFGSLMLTNSFRRKQNGTSLVLPIPVLQGIKRLACPQLPAFSWQKGTAAPVQHKLLNNNNQHLQLPTRPNMSGNGKNLSGGAFGQTEKRINNNSVKMPVKRGTMNQDLPHGTRQTSSSTNISQRTHVQVQNRSMGHGPQQPLPKQATTTASPKLPSNLQGRNGSMKQSCVKTGTRKGTRGGTSAMLLKPQGIVGVPMLVRSVPGGLNLPKIRHGYRKAIRPSFTIMERIEEEIPTFSESTGAQQASATLTQLQNPPDPMPGVSTLPVYSDVENVETQHAVELEVVQAEVKRDVEQEKVTKVEIEVEQEEAPQVKTQVEQEEAPQVKTQVEQEEAVVEQEQVSEVEAEVEEEEAPEIKTKVEHEETSEPEGQKKLNGEFENFDDVTIKAKQPSPQPPSRSEGAEGGKVIPPEKYRKRTNRFLRPLPPKKRYKIAPSLPKKLPTLKVGPKESLANGTYSESPVVVGTSSATSGSEGVIVNTEVNYDEGKVLVPKNLEGREDECNKSTSWALLHPKPTPDRISIPRACKNSTGVAKVPTTHLQQNQTKKWRKKVTLKELKRYVPNMAGTNYKLPKLTAKGSYYRTNGSRIWKCLVCNQREKNVSTRPMIACDQRKCSDWYHFDCVGIKDEFPEKDPWYCLRCIYNSTINPKRHFPKLFKRPKKITKSCG